MAQVAAEKRRSNHMQRRIKNLQKLTESIEETGMKNHVKRTASHRQNFFEQALYRILCGNSAKKIVNNYYKGNTKIESKRVENKTTKYEITLKSDDIETSAVADKKSDAEEIAFGKYLMYKITTGREKMLPDQKEKTFYQITDYAIHFTLKSYNKLSVVVKERFRKPDEHRADEVIDNVALADHGNELNNALAVSEG